jgi:hypothetical protein
MHVLRRASCTALVASDCAQLQKCTRATKGPGNEKQIQPLCTTIAIINTQNGELARFEIDIINIKPTYLPMLNDCKFECNHAA